MIQATVTVVVKPEKREEILKSMRSAVGPTLAQQGCIDSHVQVDAQDRNVLTLIQTWQTQADLDEYIRSDLYRTVLAIMESSEERPEVAFRTISKTEGLDAVKKIRRPRT